MPRKHYVSALPEPDRRESLDTFLSVFNTHPSLAHFRSLVRTGPERQLALFAALERFVQVGSPTFSPPNPDDEADQLLCDLLDVINSHPRLKGHGSAYGPDRHVANLQAFGIWRGRASIAQPSARELFATAFSNLSASRERDLTTNAMNTSPALQDCSSNGEVIEGQCTALPAPDVASTSAQTDDSVLVVTIGPEQETTIQALNSPGILRHESQLLGEVSDVNPVGWDKARAPREAWSEADGPPSVAPTHIPTRPIRRGQPPKLDDLAKGRILGLMSHGLSFRQAAAQLGVHHQTILNAMKRDEEFAQQVSEARLDAISQPLLTVVKASRTSWRAAAWLAKFLNDRRVSCYESTPEEQQLACMKAGE